MVAVKYAFLLFFLYCLILMCYYFLNRSQHAKHYVASGSEGLQALEASLKERGYSVAIKRNGELEALNPEQAQKDLVAGVNEVIELNRRSRAAWDVLSLRNHSIFFLVWLMSFVLLLILVSS